MATFFRQAIAYKQKIGFTGQFLIEPKPKEPTKHQYDYDAMTVIAFLKTFGLDKDFKVYLVRFDEISSKITSFANRALEAMFFTL